MNQLVQPNLTVVGYPDYCLGYVERVFNVFNDPDADAWTGWQNTKLKHSDAVPKNLSVPVWFAWTGTIGGITKNWGHVAVSTPYGVYTNPLSGSGHVVFPSVPALASAYGVSYVGWSEDIGNLKVIGGSMGVITTEAVVALSLGTQGTQPQSPDEYAQWVGKSDQQSWDDMITHYSAKGQAYQASLKATAEFTPYTGSALFVKK